MRIAHLPSSFLPDTVGGTEVYVRNLCEELRTIGQEVAVVWHSDRNEAVNSYCMRLPVYAPSKRANLYTKSSGHEPHGFREFLREWRPDVVHFHAFTLGAGYDHAALCVEEKIPYVVTYHTPAMSCPRGTLLRWGSEICDGRLDPQRCGECVMQKRGWPWPLARLASRLSLGHTWLPDSPLTTRIALPSILRTAQSYWSKFFSQASRVIACAEFCRDVLITNGVDSSQVQVLRQALPGHDRERTLRLPVMRSAERPLRLGYFGRIAPEKGPKLLPDAVRALRNQGIEAVGSWVGPCDEQQLWTKQLFSDGAPEVSYLHKKQGDELAHWIREQDVIVVPSITLETGPLTVLEAWDQGVPVIGSNHSGIRDFMMAADLEDCLFEANNPVAIATAVRRMLDWNRPAPVVKVPGMRTLAEQMIDIYKHANHSSESRDLTRFALL